MKEYRARKAKEMKRLEIVAHNAEQIADIERDISRDQFDEIERLRAENEHLRAMRNVTKKAESNDGAFDALASKLAMTEKAFLSSQGEIKRLYAEIAELQREVVKLSKKHQKGYL
jgi:chromosome segregation ATPase